MNILLTGASGFLGSALALYWLHTGHQVSLLIRPASDLRRLHGLDAGFNIGRCSTDIEVKHFITKVQPEVVVHTACSYGRNNETKLQLFDANLRLGVVIVQALQQSKTSCTFINTGSALAPDVSFYALSKNQFAEWGRLFALQSDCRLRFVNVQLQHMYGSGDDVSKFTTHVLHACWRNDPKLALTAGEQARDLIYIDDVVNAYDTLARKCDQLDAASEIDVGSGVAPTIRQFVEAVHRLTGSKTELHFGALTYRENEPMHCQANINRMKQLGWQPAFDLESGLKKTIEMEFKT